MKTSPNVQVVHKTRCCFTLEEKENIIRSHIICVLIPFFFISRTLVEQPHMIIDANNFVVKSKLNFNSLRKLSCTFQCFGGGQKQGDLVTW